MLSKVVSRNKNTLVSLSYRNASSIIKAFATVDPFDKMGANSKGLNLINGKWESTKELKNIVDPLTGDVMIKIPNTSIPETEPLI